MSAHDLLDRARTPRTRLHGRVVGHHAHRASVDPADAGDDAVGGEIAGQRVGEQRVFDERVFVEQERDAGRARTACSGARASPPSLARLPSRARSVSSRTRSPSVTMRSRSAGSGRPRAGARSGARGRRSPARAARSRAARRGRCRYSMPMSSSMCTRSSVTALPDAPGAYGQPPRPPIDASKCVTPRPSAGDDVRERGAARVVEVQADAIGSDARVLERVDEIVDAARRGHAGGVAEREPIGARVEQMPGDLGDALGRDIAFVRTPERGRHDGLDRHVLAVREVDELARRDRATRRRCGARSSGCGSRSRRRRARARRPSPPTRARRPSGSARARCTSTPGRRSMRAMTSSEPAIGGIASARTNDAASMRRSPVRESASISRTRSATGTGASFCSPSRGPTSRISTRSGHCMKGNLRAPATRSGAGRGS